jgi:hypothetical protein
MNPNCRKGENVLNTNSKIPAWYAEDRVGGSIAAGDIIYDLIDYASPEKHDQFLAWAGAALGVTFDHPTVAEAAEKSRDGYYQIRPPEKPSGQPNHLALVLAMASDWLETVDPSYAENVLGFSLYSDEVQTAIALLHQEVMLNT